MIFVYVIFSVCAVAIFVAGVIEQRGHYRNLDKIPHRVLVNGIRGKSSITRLCAGALRGGGRVVVAKTTGTAARFVFPDGSEEPVYRKFGLANVVEQIGIVRRAATYHPDVLVIECMAVTPALQEINQNKLVRSTIGVLCNVREDHLAEMGPTLDHVARSLSRAMPVGGVCVTAEQTRLELLQQEADRRRCRLISVDPASVSDEEMAAFGWITFKENVAIALAVAAELGVDRQAALAGMWDAAPDPGVLSVVRPRYQDKLLRFANVFAANDPESTMMNIEQLKQQNLIGGALTIVINCRPDRIERNGQMGAMTERLDPHAIVLIGDPTRSARSAVPQALQERVRDLGGRRDPRLLLDGVLQAAPDRSSIVAVGNIHGQGEVLLHEVAGLPTWSPEQWALPRPAASPPPPGPPRLPAQAVPAAGAPWGAR